MVDKLFIYCFDTPQRKYLYDFNTNAIVCINDTIYNYLNNEEQNKQNLDKEIDNLKELGFLKSSH